MADSMDASACSMSARLYNRRELQLICRSRRKGIHMQWRNCLRSTLDLETCRCICTAIGMVVHIDAHQRR